MDLTDHLRTIGANWWRILLIAVIIGGGVFAFSKSQKKTYRASELRVGGSAAEPERRT